MVKKVLITAVFIASVLCLHAEKIEYTKEKINPVLLYLQACGKGDLAGAKSLVKNGVNTGARYSGDGGWTDVMLAVESGNLELVKFVVENGGPVNYAPASTGFTALMKASMSNNLAIVKYLVSKKADINAKTKGDNATALFYAIANGKPKDAPVWKFLIENGADINTLFQGRYSPLYLCTELENYDFAAYLIEKGASYKTAKDTNILIAKLFELKKQDTLKKIIEQGIDPDTTDAQKNTLLILAAQNKAPDIAALLVARKASTEEKNKDGETALHFAVKNSDLLTAKVIIDSKTDINIENKLGNTPLMAAAEKGDQKMYEYLLSKKADTESVNSEKRTLLHFAAWSGNDAIVKSVLEDKNMKINAKTKTGITPVMMAAESGNINVLTMLMDKGADVKAATDSKKTALMYGASSGSLPIVKKLELAGLEVKSAENNGTTTLMHAGSSGNIELVKYLVSKGCDVNARDKNNHSVLTYAALNTDPATVFMFSGPAKTIFSKFNTRTSKLVDIKINLPMVKYLMDTPSIKFVSDQSELNTMLFDSVVATNDEAVSYFISKKANPADGKLLREAVRQNSQACVKKLLDAKADVNSADEDGYTPVIMASLAGRTEVLKQLLVKKPNLDTRVASLNGQDALMFASYNGHLDAVKLLISAGSNVNSVKKDGWSVLLIAINGNYTNVVTYIISKGAKTDFALSKSGVTPLMLAIQYNNLDVVKYLVEKSKVDINQKDANNYIALQYAELYYNKNKSISKDMYDYVVKLYPKK